MLVRFWGTRGSLPVAQTADQTLAKVSRALVGAAGRRFGSEAEAALFAQTHLDFTTHGGFGGATPCVEIEAGGEAFIVCDMGSGLREFGISAMRRCAEGHPRTYHVFLSHMHWDHIMGLPYFRPAFDSGATIIIHSGHPDAEEALRRQHEEISFAVPFEAFRATIEFEVHQPWVPFDVAGVTVSLIQQEHAQLGSFGYRFEQRGKSVVYSTDAEHRVDDMELEPLFSAFFKQASLVICDTMYSLGDTVSLKEDLGHSSNVVAVDLCHDAGAERLALFHHEPSYTDADIQRMFDETIKYEEMVRGQRPKLEVVCAYDGLEVAVDALAELDAGARRRVRITGLVAALATAVLVLLLGVRLSQPLHDLFQNITPAPPVSKKVHVVVIDADSLQTIGGWPWSRFYIARLIEEIEGRGASAIGIDLLMPEPDRLTPERFAELYGELTPAAAAEVRALPSMDAVLARVIGRSPVVLARAGVRETSFDATDQQTAPLPPAAQFKGAVPKGVASYPRAVANLPLLDGAALGHGLVNGDPDSDGVVRRAPLLATVAGQPTPGFALELARIAKGVEEIELKTSGGRLVAVQVGDRRVPAQADGRVSLRFGDWSQIQTTSAADLFRHGVAADLFKDQIVLVGLTSAGTSDVVNTPRAAETYGVYVQAQAVDAVLRGEGLRRPAWARIAEWGFGLLLAIAAWLAVARSAVVSVVAALAGGIAGALGASWAGFAGGLLLDPFPVAAPAVATSIATMAALFVEGRRLQAKLRAALQEERVKAARVEGELAAAAEIQAGMLLPREDLDRLSAVVDIDAVLKPARSVGGDLYDAFMLDEGRLCFLVGDVTGKGLPAALFMALGKSLSHNLLARPDLDLPTAMAAINAGLSRENREDMALTLLVGILHTKSGALDLICAGHENPLLADKDGQVRDVTLLGGPPLCVDPDFPYSVEHMTLEPGETLLLFSDGLTEAQAPDGALLPRPDLLALFGKAALAAKMEGVVDQVVESVRVFEAGSEPSDDLTVLAVRRDPSP